MPFFCRKKKHSTSNSAPANRLASQPINPWSAHHTPRFERSQSPFLRNSLALSTTATIAGELFLFGGHVHSSKSASNDLYAISTWDFSTTLLQTSGDVPSPRCAYGAVFTSTNLLIWGGLAFSNQNGQWQEGYDDSLYLLNFGTSDGTSVLLMSKPTSVDQNLFHSSIAKVNPCCGQWP